MKGLPNDRYLLEILRLISFSHWKLPFIVNWKWHISFLYLDIRRSLLSFFQLTIKGNFVSFGMLGFIGWLSKHGCCSAPSSCNWIMKVNDVIYTRESLLSLLLHLHNFLLWDLTWTNDSQNRFCFYDICQSRDNLGPFKVIFLLLC